MAQRPQQDGIIPVVDRFPEPAQAGIENAAFAALLVVQGGAQEGIELQGFAPGLGGQGRDVTVGGLPPGKSSQLTVGAGLPVDFLHDALLPEIGMRLLPLFSAIQAVAEIVVGRPAEQAGIECPMLPPVAGPRLMVLKAKAAQHGLCARFDAPVGEGGVPQTHRAANRPAAPCCAAAASLQVDPIYKS